jgi:hypothetical protein
MRTSLTLASGRQAKALPVSASTSRRLGCMAPRRSSTQCMARESFLRPFAGEELLRTHTHTHTRTHAHARTHAHTHTHTRTHARTHARTRTHNSAAQAVCSVRRGVCAALAGDWALPQQHTRRRHMHWRKCVCECVCVCVEKQANVERRERDCFNVFTLELTPFPFLFSNPFRYLREGNNSMQSLLLRLLTHSQSQVQRTSGECTALSCTHTHTSLSHTLHKHLSLTHIYMSCTHTNTQCAPRCCHCGECRVWADGCGICPLSPFRCCRKHKARQGVHPRL